MLDAFVYLSNCALAGLQAWPPDDLQCRAVGRHDRQISAMQVVRHAFQRHRYCGKLRYVWVLRVSGSKGGRIAGQHLSCAVEGSVANDASHWPEIFGRRLDVNIFV